MAFRKRCEKPSSLLKKLQHKYAEGPRTVIVQAVPSEEKFRGRTGCSFRRKYEKAAEEVWQKYSP